MPLPPLKDPGDVASRLKGNLAGFVFAGILFPTLLALNVAQTLSLVLLPLSRNAFRKTNRFFADTWWGWCVKLARRLHRVQVNITGDDVPPQENAIVVANHQQMTDIPVLFELAWRKGRLGDLKWYVKNALKYFPGIGWGMLFLDCLFIKRNWTADREYIDRVFRRILKDRVPAWVVSFAEGTRSTPSKLEGSREYARQKGLPELKHLLLPRTKGFVATFAALRDHVDAVYDVTIGYERGVPTLTQWCKGYVPRAHLHVRRFPSAILPRSDPELTAWLIARYQEKDALLNGYYKSGAFSLTEEGTKGDPT